MNIGVKIMRITTNDGDTVQALRKAFEGHEPIDFMGKKFIATNQQVHLEGGDDSPTVTQCLHVVKQVTWNGPEDGLPPVGTVCELRTRNGGWGEAEIKYHGRAVCVWLWVRRDGNTEQVEHAESPDRLEFRPIRTAEQLAAEAHRAAYMDKLSALWDADTKRSDFLEAVYALIVQAGKP